MKLKKKYQGKSTYRFKSNPREKRFAMSWQRENDRPNAIADILEWLAGDGCSPGEVSEESRVLCNTLIQWLGSPVGSFWLTETLKRAK